MKRTVLSMLTAVCLAVCSFSVLAAPAHGVIIVVSPSGGDIPN